MRYSKYFILDILLYFALYTGYINKIQQHVLPYNISHISLLYLISLIFPKALKIPTVVLEPLFFLLIEWKEICHML